MRRGMAVVVVWVALALGIVPVAAQQPAPGDPHHSPPPAGSPPGAPPAPSAGAPGRMMSMETCRQMMGNMMEMPMMPNQPMDPKTMASMIEMRGEMMKAMGEIMMKHARKMQGMPR